MPVVVYILGQKVGNDSHIKGQYNSLINKLKEFDYAVHYDRLRMDLHCSDNHNSDQLDALRASLSSIFLMVDFVVTMEGWENDSEALRIKKICDLAQLPVYHFASIKPLQEMNLPGKFISLDQETII